MNVDAGHAGDFQLDRLTLAASPLELLQELDDFRSEEHTSELLSRFDLVCRLLLEKKKIIFLFLFFFLFFNYLSTTETFTLSLHDALPILDRALFVKQLGIIFLPA